MKDECESPFGLAEGATELTRGDEVLGEYATGGCGNGSEGNFSLAYAVRWVARLAKDA